MSAAREVIQDWADSEAGYTFERGRMEKAVREVCLDNPAKLHSSTAATTKPALKLNKDDVDFIVSASVLAKIEREGGKLTLLYLTGQGAHGDKGKGRGGFIRQRG